MEVLRKRLLGATFQKYVNTGAHWYLFLWLYIYIHMPQQVIAYSLWSHSGGFKSEHRFPSTDLLTMSHILPFNQWCDHQCLGKINGKLSCAGRLFVSPIFLVFNVIHLSHRFLGVVNCSSIYLIKSVFVK